MIPKRAIFYWEGTGMSWLRAESLSTFARLNPDWEISLLGGDSTAPLINRVHRSDHARYQALADGGGIYFDTDIIFCRPIPEGWLTHDLLLPLDADGRLGHVACLGGMPGTPFFRTCAERAAGLLRSEAPKNYQALGVNLMRSVMNTMSLGRSNTKWIPPDCFVMIPWFDAQMVWGEWAGPFPELAVGIHWYGGDHLSLSMEPEANEGWMRDSPSILARAWRQAQGFGSAETLAEQHGLG